MKRILSNTKMIFLLSVILVAVGCSSQEKRSESVPSEPTTPSATAAVESEKPAEPAVAEPSIEWNGTCRKVVNEAGQELKKSSEKRLQSSYIVEGTNIIWMVKSFSDSKCKSLVEGNRYDFKCDVSPLQRAATCKQVSSKSWKNRSWNSEAMVDHSGKRIELVMSYHLVPTKGQAAKLMSRSISDDGDPSSETLTKSE